MQSADSPIEMFWIGAKPTQPSFAWCVGVTHPWNCADADRIWTEKSRKQREQKQIRTLPALGCYLTSTPEAYWTAHPAARCPKTSVNPQFRCNSRKASVQDVWQEQLPTLSRKPEWREVLFVPVIQKGDSRA